MTAGGSLWGLPYGQWFGEPWPNAEYRAEVCSNDSLRVPVPLGGICLLCTELIDEDDRGVLTPYVKADRTTAMAPMHIECQMRSIMGNARHMRGECHHVGECNENSTQTYRQEALEVWELLQKRWGMHG